jgi:hypothetical protein
MLSDMCSLELISGCGHGISVTIVVPSFLTEHSDDEYKSWKEYFSIKKYPVYILRWESGSVQNLIQSITKTAA